MWNDKTIVTQRNQGRFWRLIRDQEHSRDGGYCFVLNIERSTRLEWLFFYFKSNVRFREWELLWNKKSVTCKYQCPIHDLQLLFIAVFHLPGMFINTYNILKRYFCIDTFCTVPYYDTNWCSCIKLVFIISCLSDNLKHGFDFPLL